MTRGVVAVLLVVAIYSQLVNLWFVRRIGSELPAQMQTFLWIRRLLMISSLLSGGLSFVATNIKISLQIIFATTLVAWAVSGLVFRKSYVRLQRRGGGATDAARPE